jgi:Ca-activated chloride channel family protein
MFELAYPWLLALLPAPILAWYFLPPYREREASVRVPFLDRLAEATGETPRRGGLIMKRQTLQKLIAPIAWVALVVALARPQLVEPPIVKTESARDLMLGIDLSGSMEVPDMFNAAGERVTRLEATKEVIDGFVERRQGDRIGIIVFGTQAFVQTPFTQDHELVRALLAQLQPAMAGPQTMLGDGIGLGIKAFDQSEARDRVMILLTDGSDTGSKVPPSKAAEIAASGGLTIHTIAVGDPASVGEAEMDLETLETIARTTGGTSFRADDREQLEDIYRQIDALTPEEIDTTSYRPTRPLYHWPLGAALIALILHQALMITVGGVKRMRASDA